MFQQVQVISCVVNFQMLQHERPREKRIRSRCSKSVKRATHKNHTMLAVVKVMLPSNGQSHNRHGFGVSDVCVAGRNPLHFMSLSITKSATFPRIFPKFERSGVCALDLKESTETEMDDEMLSDHGVSCFQKKDDCERTWASKGWTLKKLCVFLLGERRYGEHPVNPHTRYRVDGFFPVSCCLSNTSKFVVSCFHHVVVPTFQVR